MSPGAIVIGLVAFVLFTFKGPLQQSGSGSKSKMTDTELVQEAQRRGLTK